MEALGARWPLSKAWLYRRVPEFGAEDHPGVLLVLFRVVVDGDDPFLVVKVPSPSSSSSSTDVVGDAALWLIALEVTEKDLAESRDACGTSGSLRNDSERAWEDRPPHVRLNSDSR